MQTGSAPQNKIAVIWDFDRTLIAGHMQRPLFAYFGVDEQQFWREANSYSEFFKKRGHELISTDCAYLLHILAYVRAGRFPGLSNQLLAKLGQELVPHTGLPEFFDMLRDQVRADRAYRKYDIDVEHYIVSSGLRQMILGSVFGPMATDVWACEFVEELPYPGYLDGAVPPDDWRDESTSRIQAIGYQLDNTTKTRAVFEINKGCNFGDFNVNDSVPDECRRIPFENMVYIADGMSDVPVFSVINHYGGRTYGVYDPLDPKSFREVSDLQKQARVNSMGPADYRVGTQTHLWISNTVHDIASRITTERAATLDRRIGRAPSYRTQHIDVPLLTAEQLAMELTSPTPGVVRAVDDARVKTSPLPSLRPLPPPPTRLDASTPPRDFLAACEQISEHYKPITDIEVQSMLVSYYARSAARSQGGRRRGSPRDISSLTSREIELMLDRLRSAKSVHN